MGHRSPGQDGLVDVGAARSFSDGGAVGAEARAAFAEDDLLLDVLELSLLARLFTGLFRNLEHAPSIIVLLRQVGRGAHGIPAAT